MSDPTTLPPVVTLFESYGAGADEVGPQVAAALGVPWVGQQVSTADLDAADPKGTGRISVSQFIVSTGMTDIGSTDLVQSPLERLIQRQAMTVKELSAKGGVILGRNATMVLAGRPNTLHVKLDASPQFRVERAASRTGSTFQQADLRRRREDAARAELSLESWHWDPRLTEHFDLVINTETFGVERTVRVIVDALEWLSSHSR